MTGRPWYKEEHFLANAKELHQRREVHQKGIFHANYENTSGFGTVKQFFKNIKLLLQKNDMNALQNTCLERCLKYTDVYSSSAIRKDELGLDALSQEINGIKKGLEKIKGKQKLDRDHPISKTLLTLEVLQKGS